MCPESQILCFKHCRSTSIFCKIVPTACPLCQETIDNFLIPPFIIPNPLVNAKDCPCSLVIRPSKGDFLNDFQINNDLHIGITNSQGLVVEYDMCGLIVNDIIRWKNCVSIHMIPESWESHWDELLKKMCSDCQWSPNRYNEDTFNCFNFVISFLKNLKFQHTQYMNKEELCQEFVLPKLEMILKYTLLYKNLKNANVYIQN
ncbi:MKRN2 opposite strand protein [Trichogramma pretiosum]|uniref:MKRN2 opposite strand protein n=1 Tax=Trichogramma pretiosum TaxID=7493 RepID=UPI0006C97D45|nr:MKRN2 opposite strand protein [Trichogramma pretiosum]